MGKRIIIWKGKHFIPPPPPIGIIDIMEEGEEGVMKVLDIITLS